MDRIAYRTFRRGLCHHRGRLADVASANVRKTFLEYFQRDHNHLFIPSSTVQPKLDPTLSFVVSGMNQFKDVFLGKELPAARRVVNYQKCIRIKGKHNDLDQVGLDGTHHTFFEMLGNWSFQDYFKREACLMAWNLLTEVYGLPPERLYVTYFKGDDALELSPDLETREIWREIGVPEEKILPFGMAHNFWEMGRIGPCGPSTEIHYDHVPGRREASGLVNVGDPLVTELWNIVFIEFERGEGGNLRSLGNTFVDTGMGFERLVAILQDQSSNYETDLFRPLYGVIERLSGARKYMSSYGGDSLDQAYRMLADHARMLTVALGDGMTPFNHYRLRIMFRKSFAIQRDAFKMEAGLLKELSNHVAEILSPAFPEIGWNLNRIQWVIDHEEESFKSRQEDAKKLWKALVDKFPRLTCLKSDLKEEFVKGYKYLEKTVLDRGEKRITGEIAYKLFDTYGMSREAIEKFAEILGLSFNVEDFVDYSQQVSERSRVESQHLLLQQKEKKKLEIPPEAEKTDDSFKFAVNPETGHPGLPEVDVKVVCVLLDGKAVTRVNAQDLEGNVRLGFVLDKTVLHHRTREMTSDRGVLVLSDSVTFRINHVVKHGNHVVHYAKFETVPESYEFTPGMTGVLRVSEKDRKGLMRANTAALLVKSFLHSQLNVFSEKSTEVEADAFKIQMMGYPLNHLTERCFHIEKELRSALSVEHVVELKMCSPEEIRGMDNFVRKSGDTFIKAETPVATVRAPWMTARLICSGPFVQHLPEIEDFVVVNVETPSYRVKSLHCLTGPRAAEAKYNNASIAERWNQLRDFHIISGVDQETMDKRIELVEQFLNEVKNTKNTSYYIRTSIREEAMMKLSRMEKTMRLNLRYQRREERKSAK